MADLTMGPAQQATSYVTASTETPKWMQDAIYNQIQWAQNVANQPYQKYELPTVADPTAMQQQAYQQIQAGQGAWKPAMSAAQTGMQGLASSATAPNLAAAQNPYLGQNYLTGEVSKYMNPYQQNVLDVIAKQGARNLSENLLPGVSDAFVKAGQFGSGRMGEFGARALRDTQESILNQQAQAAQTGYGQALATAQQQQGIGLTAAGNVNAAQAADYTRQMSALQNMGALAQAGQGMGYADTAALEAAGAEQYNIDQAKMTAAYNQFQEPMNYPWQQMSNLMSITKGLQPSIPVASTQAKTTTGEVYAPSVLAQLGALGSAYKGFTS